MRKGKIKKIELNNVISNNMKIEQYETNER
jgi:hypothetical protein